VIRKSGPPRWVRLQAGGDLASLSASLSEFRESVERGALSSPGSADGSWIPQARALWKARVEPLEPHLRGVKELVLIPSWTMGSFPVDMLVDEKGRFVGERFAIAHAPSATVYALLRGAARRGTADPRTALLVGDPPFRRGNEPAPASEAFTVATLRSAMRGDARAIESLPRLKHSRDEIAGVAKLMPDARVLLGGEASETAVASLVGSGAISRFHVVHFATHALVDYERPQRSGLVLSQLDAARGVPERDGIVTGAEITESWKLDANLVTLSACQTAIGRTIFGEGVVGLSYPIFQAGARSLLVSQWKVDDEATALLMTRFYHNWLGEGAMPWSPRLNKAASLREAKRWLREYRDSRGHHPFDHPFYWAAFVLVGDPD
jgi:CHAT domain-containing protein